jgi:SAM-dependent methyltransferase
LTADADKDILIAGLWELGTCGIIEEPGGLRAFFEESIASIEIRARWPSRAGEIRPEPIFPEPSFRRDNWEPVTVGERFYVATPWVSIPTPPGRFRLEIEASTAFGTGRHESTQLCLLALEKHLKHGDTVLDVGCGSGILTRASQMLGAGQAVGCDISFDALTIARLHVQAPLFAGSADAVIENFADITVANIGPSIVDRLAAELKRVTKPGGIVLVTGFIRENPPKRFRFEELLDDGDWQCWLCRPENIDSAALGEEPSTGADSEKWWL